MAAGVGAPIPTAATALYLVLARQSAEWNPDAAISGPTNEPAVGGTGWQHLHLQAQRKYQPSTRPDLSLYTRAKYSLPHIRPQLHHRRRNHYCTSSAANAVDVYAAASAASRRCRWRVPFVGGRPNRLTTATGCRWAVAFASSHPSICLD